MAAIPGNDVRNLETVNRPRIALVVVRVSGQVRMRPNTHFLAYAVDIGQHRWASAVRAAARIRRMVRGNDHGLSRGLRLRERRREKRELLVVNRRSFVTLTRDHPRIL